MLIQRTISQEAQFHIFFPDLTSILPSSPQNCCKMQGKCCFETSDLDVPTSLREQARSLLLREVLLKEVLAMGQQEMSPG